MSPTTSPPSMPRSDRPSAKARVRAWYSPHVVGRHNPRTREGRVVTTDFAAIAQAADTFPKLLRRNAAAVVADEPDDVAAVDAEIGQAEREGAGAGVVLAPRRSSGCGARRRGASTTPAPAPSRSACPISASTAATITAFTSAKASRYWTSSSSASR
jgi:hypothetical protein